ncbi:arylsulfatase A [Citreicella sp. SE45]|nr:arylsulfatase A [Citreicella sp. SE45]
MSFLAVISAVLVPAIAYYASLFLAVFFEAEKPGISAAEDDEPIEAPDAQDCLNLLLVFGPIALIVWLLVSGLSPAVASIAAILMLFLMSLINPAIRRHPWKLIEALAEGRLAFDRFCVTSPVCMPNRASRMTCRMPSGHGVRFNGIPLSKRNVTFVELLRDAGYDTALIGKSHQQTFTGIPPVLPRPETRPGLHRANGELSEAVRNDPTSPDYRLEEPSFWAGESPAVPTPFYGVDHVELVTGHGDHLGDHRLLYKGSEQYEQTTRVPFIWADPASDRRGRCDRIGQTLDIGATILERARLEQAWGCRGAI